MSSVCLLLIQMWCRPLQWLQTHLLPPPIPLFHEVLLSSKLVVDLGEDVDSPSSQAILSQGHGAGSSGRTCYEICSKLDHNAIYYNNRLNITYQVRNPSRQLSAMHISASLLINGLLARVLHIMWHMICPIWPNHYYAGNDRCMVGNGSGLHSSHIGSTVLSTPSLDLHLNNFLQALSYPTIFLFFH